MALLTLLNVAPILEPRVRAPPMIATAISAAISPYSIAVAPDSSLTNRFTSDRMRRILAIR